MRHPSQQKGSSTENALPSQSTRPKHATNDSTNGVQEAPKWWPGFWHFLQAIGILAGIAYAIVTWCMWRDSHNNFMLQERAWLHLDNEWRYQPKEGSPIAIDVRLLNTGNTIAKRIEASFLISVVPSAARVVFDYSTPARFDHLVGILAPKGYRFLPVVRWSSPGEVTPLTKTEIDDLTSGRAYLAIYGRGTYVDVFGQAHWFHYCNWEKYYDGMASFHSQECVQYSDLGDGEMPQN